MAMNNEHAGAVLSKIFENRNESETITLTAGVGDQSFLIHRCVLMANSDYFTASLGPNFNQDNKNEFILDETDAPTLKAIVDFCYTGCIDLTEGNASKYLAIASRLQLHFLEPKCWRIIADNLSIYNAAETLVVADKYSGHEIRQRALTLFCNSFDKLPPSHIDGLDHRLMKEIIGADTIDATEEFIFERLMSWYRADKDNRGPHMPELLKSIPFALIPVQSLNGNMIQKICIKFDCLEYLIAEHRRRTASPTSIDSIRRYHWVYFLCIRRKLVSGAGYSAIKTERYNRALNESEVIGEIAIDRDVEYSALHVHEKKVYILGGRINNTYQKSASVFDLTTGKEEVLPEMNSARAAFSSVIFGKHIYVFGGFYNKRPLNSCERFDMESKIWTILKPMNDARGFASASIFNGYIYVAGGVSHGFPVLNSVELYDPTTDDWLYVASMNEGRSSFVLITSNIFLYAIGHKSSERYDALKDSWTKVELFNGNSRRIDRLSLVETAYGVFFMNGTGEFGNIDYKADAVCSMQKLCKSKYEPRSYWDRYLYKFN